MNLIRLPTLTVVRGKDTIDILINGESIGAVVGNENPLDATERVVRAIQSRLDKIAMDQVMEKFRTPTNKPIPVRKRVRKK